MTTPTMRLVKRSQALSRADKPPPHRLREEVSGKGRGGDVIWQAGNRLSRDEALRHWTAAGAWFSRETGKKGQIKVGQFADIAVLDRDYFTIPEDDIINIEADLTFSGGKIVHAKGAFAYLDPPALPTLPEWSPVPVFGAPGAPAPAATPLMPD